MNTYTETLSIQNTKFADASGLSQENAGTARELSVLLRKIRQEEKHIIDITSLPMYLSSDNGWVNNNPFVNDQNYIGGKHGYTHESLYTAALIFNEPLNNGVNREVGYIVLGSHDLQSDIPLLQNAVQTQLVNL
jgi:D-alanyl-D-alanine carboxypeptidase